MRKCVICSKRIWSSPVVVPDKGSYHYECAENSGLLLGLDTKQEIEKVVREIEEITADLERIRTLGKGDGLSRSKSRELLERLSAKKDYMDSLMVVHTERAQRKKEGV